VHGIVGCNGPKVNARVRPFEAHRTSTKVQLSTLSSISALDPRPLDNSAEATLV
jgi:hypothetical protein